MFVGLKKCSFKIKQIRNIHKMICPLCLIPAMKKDEIVATACGHCYHKTCIVKWLSEKKFCPSCRRPATTFTLKKLYIELSDTENSLNMVNDELIDGILSRDLKIKKLEKKIAKCCGVHKQTPSTCRSCTLM